MLKIITRRNYFFDIIHKWKGIIARFQQENDIITNHNRQKSNDLKFIWLDAYKPTLKSTSPLLIFDWINILWNYGATLSKLGAQVNRASDEGIKAANKYFQQSAGVFEFIHTLITSTQVKSSLTASSTNPLPSLSHESLTFVKQLLLAQAQLCFYEKAVRDKRNTGTMKSSVIAKLASQTTILFKAAANTCKLSSMQTILDQSWSSHVDYQVSICQAAAEYWQAQASKEVALVETRGFGEEIVRLAQAEFSIIAKYKS